jgi:hypothetical protein
MFAFARADLQPMPDAGSLEAALLNDQVAQLKKELERRGEESASASQSTRPWAVAAGCLGAALGAALILFVWLGCKSSRNLARKAVGCQVKSAL